MIIIEKNQSMYNLKRELPLNQYPSDKRTLDGLIYWCKACVAKYNQMSKNENAHK